LLNRGGRTGVRRGAEIDRRRFEIRPESVDGCQRDRDRSLSVGLSARVCARIGAHTVP